MSSLTHADKAIIITASVFFSVAVNFFSNIAPEHTEPKPQITEQSASTKQMPDQTMELTPVNISAVSRNMEQETKLSATIILLDEKYLVAMMHPVNDKPAELQTFYLEENQYNYLKQHNTTDLNFLCYQIKGSNQPIYYMETENGYILLQTITDKTDFDSYVKPEDRIV